MAILTLTPSRFGTVFPTGSYAYLFADRAVTKLGILITPTPVIVQESDGAIVFPDVEPNENVDEQVPFNYTVAAFDDEGHKLYCHSIVMPSADTTLFDLIPEPVDLDACEPPTPLPDNSG